MKPAMYISFRSSYELGLRNVTYSFLALQSVDHSMPK
jgi:hypothetical protein